MAMRFSVEVFHFIHYSSDGIDGHAVARVLQGQFFPNADLWFGEALPSFRRMCRAPEKFLTGEGRHTAWRISRVT